MSNRCRRFVRPGWVRAMVLAGVLGLLPAAALGQAYHMVGADGSFTTIQAAIDDPQTLPGDCIVLIDPVHTESGIVVTKSVTIQGLGPSQTIVQAAADENSASDRVFTITAGNWVYLWNMTIRYGRVVSDSGEGGGILNCGTLRVANVTITRNRVQTATGDGSVFGGGIRNRGTLYLTDSTVSYNLAKGADDDPEGGNAFGGGLVNGQNSRMEVTRCLFQANEARGGTGSMGTGIARGGAVASAQVIPTTEVSEFTNCTFTGNVADEAGGAWYGSRGASFLNCTIVYNTAGTGGGIASGSGVDDTGPAVGNSLIAYNTAAGGTGPDLCDNIQSRGCNLIGEAAGATLDIDGNGNTGEGNLLGQAPQIGPLDLHDGSVPCYSLQAGSPCVDVISAGFNGLGSDELSSDARGMQRPYNAQGDIGAFELQPMRPTVTTGAVSDVLARSASGGGEVVSDGGAAVTSRGLVWGMMPYPTIDDGSQVSTNGEGLGTFTHGLTQLSPGASYYVVAYAANAAGVSYGEQVEFSTPPDVPLVMTSGITDITATQASGGGELEDHGGFSVTARGVVWSTSHNPTVEVHSGMACGDNQIAGYTVALTNLSPGTRYYARAYATNELGSGYGEEVTFLTPAVLPTLTTAVISNATSCSAVSGGIITSNGGSEISACGVVWSTSANPTLGQNMGQATGDDGQAAFVCQLTGLARSTVYHVRAYATNSVGTAYGEPVTFATPAELAVVVTGQTISVGVTTAMIGGAISDDGGSEVTAYGLVWGTEPGPTVETGSVAAAAGGDSFTAELTDLLAGTTYYVQAFATNSAGTAYGSEMTFTIPAEEDDYPMIPLVMTPCSLLPAAGLIGVFLMMRMLSGTAATAGSPRRTQRQQRQLQQQQRQE